MSLSIGIIGLPNAGKSTLFNALMRGHHLSRLGPGSTVTSRAKTEARVADYPFTTIEPNLGVVEVPDLKLQKIAEILGKPILKSKILNLKSKIIPTTIKFVDIAGLVKNAHKGEGLGNQFLSHIREVDALLILLNGFDKDVQPKDDLETLLTELELADLDKSVEQKLIDRPRLVVVNVAEKDLAKNYDFADLVIDAKTEAGLVDLSEEEQKEYLAALGLKKPVLGQLIKKAYQLLGLITFYTLKDPSTILTAGQVQAWPIAQGTSAPAAAGKVHTDFERGFIRAEVVAYEDFVDCNGWREAADAGKLKIEGKDYLIRDSDIVHFRMNT